MEKIITIDGPSSSGKSELALLLSKRLRWKWLSTGVLYRGMAYVGHKEKFNHENYLEFFRSGDWRIELDSLSSLFFYKGCDISLDIYNDKVDHLASRFALNAEFRKALIPIQRAFYVPNSSKGLILEGRDCGTVIFPSAPLRIFLTAPTEIRAERRANDPNRPQDASQSKEEVLQAQKIRDERDKNRSCAPLARPENSLYLDSGTQSAKELADTVYKKAKEIFSTS